MTHRLTIALLELDQRDFSTARAHEAQQLEDELRQAHLAADKQ